MIERLSEFIRKQGVSVRSFEQKISASDGMIRRAINNNTDIQCKWIENIADNYPNLNIEWLLTGHGEMLKEAKRINSNEINDDYKDRYIEQLEKENKRLIELVDGFMTGDITISKKEVG